MSKLGIQNNINSAVITLLAFMLSERKQNDC